MAKCVRCIIAGRVQGVFFRESTRRKAAELGVDGWVRNRRNGTVEVLACGDTLSIAALRRWLAAGPPAAAVASVTCVDANCDDAPPGFTIRPTD